MNSNEYFTWRGMVVKSALASSTKLVLHTLHSHMSDVGDNCYPSIETICKEASLSNRVVILHLKIAAEVGFITYEKHGFKGKKWARNEYRATFPSEIIDENRVKIATMAVTQSHNQIENGSDFKDTMAVTQSHTNYPYNYPVVFDSIEPKTTPREETPISENSPMRPEGALACRLVPLGIAVTSMNPTLCKWVADKIPTAFILQCVELARLQKPLPEKIPANYLNSIIRSELKPKKPDNSWAMSDAGIDAKARELRVTCPPNIQNYRDFAKYLSEIIAERQRGKNQAAAA
jgi:Helix-turn-helix domain